MANKKSNNKRRKKVEEEYKPKALKQLQKEEELEKKVENRKKGKKKGKKKIPKRDSNGKKIKFKKRHPKLTIFIRICIFLFIIGCIALAGILVGIYYGLFGQEFEISKDDLIIGATNSIIVDSEGNEIVNLSGDEQRSTITLEEMSPYLADAYIAIEDKDFYTHSGVDLSRTAAAVVYTLLGDSSFGGSTITQQLVKNITDDDESSGIAGIYRKIKEWSKAFQVERMISKDEILELYLNILYVGGSDMYGVELGAQYYFNKSASELDLAECAYLAGINHAPSAYNPYSTTKDQEAVKEMTTSRVLTVLSEMKAQGMIESEEEYNAAVAKVEAGFTFENGTTTLVSSYSYHTDAVIDQVVTQVMEEKSISWQLAENYVYSSGLTIYSTVDLEVQATIEAEYNDTSNLEYGVVTTSDGSLLNEHSQSAMVVIDYTTGNVVGVVGGFGEKEILRIK